MGMAIKKLWILNSLAPNWTRSAGGASIGSWGCLYLHHTSLDNGIVSHIMAWSLDEIRS